MKPTTFVTAFGADKHSQYTARIDPGGQEFLEEDNVWGRVRLSGAGTMQVNQQARSGLCGGNCFDSHKLEL